MMPISANFAGSTPLEQIAGHLEKAAGVHLLLDAPALELEGLSPQTEVRLTAEAMPLRDALHELLTPLGLVYRAVDRNVLEITTPAALSERTELEFYPAGDLVGGNLTPEILLERLIARLPPTAGSAEEHRARFYWDAPSKCLLVLEPQDLQRQIEGALSEFRAERGMASR